MTNYRNICGNFEYRQKNYLGETMKAGISAEIDLKEFKLIEGKYYVSDEPQGGPAWMSQRFSLVTASKANSAVNPGNRFKGPKELAQEMRKRIETVPNEAMKWGTEMEPIARKLYELENSVEIKTHGLMIPIWDLRIGCSLDGMVNSDLIIEIKCPKYMYNPIVEYMEYEPPGLGHIWDSHYDQMQMCMVISGARNCDYYVLDSLYERFQQRIPFNVKYWNKFLYPRINRFFDKYFPEFTVNKPKKLHKIT